MTATLAGKARSSVHGPDVIGTKVHRIRGAAPLARPEISRPQSAAPARSALRGSVPASACNVTSPAARREGLFLKGKVAAVAILALVGTGASVAEFASWSEADPSVEFVAGDPAWAHVTGR